MTYFYALQVIHYLLPISQQSIRGIILIIYIIQENKMSKKLVFIRNW